MTDRKPRIRNADKTPGPYPLSHFPSGFASALGREVVYLLATRPAPTIEGQDWEQIFARLLDARWKPSNVGLDDVVLETTAWGAKTIKQDNPYVAKRIRLICGRNSPNYSFEEPNSTQLDPDVVGSMVLEIWNARVSAIRAKYENVRTVVLLKSDDLLELTMFEYETVMFPPDEYRWEWNKRKNLEGYSRSTDQHKFTWQPHGSQFTVVEDVPKKKLSIRIKQPPLLPPHQVLEMVGFDDSWVEVIERP
jgi:hypothetical protein